MPNHSPRSYPRPQFTGCFLRGGKHFARGCPQRVGGTSRNTSAQPVLRLCGLRYETRISFFPLSEDFEADVVPAAPALCDSCVCSETTAESVNPAPTSDGGSGSDSRGSAGAPQKRRSNRRNRRSHGGGRKKADKSVKASSLIAVSTSQLNGMKDDIPEWEEIEVTVDSGAGVSVIKMEDVAAAHVGEGDPTRKYKLADGSLIPNRGHKCFVAHTDSGHVLRMNTNITDVDEPLLSVSQMVIHGATVVFAPDRAGGSYISSNGARIPLEYKDKVYKVKMWIPREQPLADPPLRPFPGQHCVRA